MFLRGKIGHDEKADQQQQSRVIVVRWIQDKDEGCPSQRVRPACLRFYPLRKCHDHRLKVGLYMLFESKDER